MTYPCLQPLLTLEVDMEPNAQDAALVDVNQLHRRVRELTQELDDLIAQVSQVRYGGTGGWDPDRLEKALAHLKTSVDTLHSAQVELMSARK